MLKQPVPLKQNELSQGPVKTHGETSEDRDNRDNLQITKERGIFMPDAQGKHVPLTILHSPVYRYPLIATPEYSGKRGKPRGRPPTRNRFRTHVDTFPSMMHVPDATPAVIQDMSIPGMAAPKIKEEQIVRHFLEFLIPLKYPVYKTF